MKESGPRETPAAEFTKDLSPETAERICVLVEKLKNYDFELATAQPEAENSTAAASLQKERDLLAEQLRQTLWPTIKRAASAFDQKHFTRLRQAALDANDLTSLLSVYILKPVAYRSLEPGADPAKLTGFFMTVFNRILERQALLPATRLRRGGRTPGPISLTSLIETDEQGALEYREDNLAKPDEDNQATMEQKIAGRELFHHVLNKGEVLDGFLLSLHFGLGADCFEQWRSHVRPILERWHSGEKNTTYKFNTQKLSDLLLSMDASFFDTEHTAAEIAELFGPVISVTTLNNRLKIIISSLNRSFTDTPSTLTKRVVSPADRRAQKLAALEKRRVGPLADSTSLQASDYELETSRLKQYIEEAVGQEDFVRKTLVTLLLDIQPEPLNIYVVKDLNPENKLSGARVNRMSRHDIKVSFYTFPATPAEESSFKSELIEQLYDHISKNP